MLLEPCDPECDFGVIYFNNAGFLNMCGHATIGLIATLSYMGLISPGEIALETPVGKVVATLHESGDISFKNVPAYRYLHGLELDVPGYGRVTGDVAWGGNWFFLCSDHGQEISMQNLECLSDLTWKIRLELEARGISGENGGLIDHIELVGPASGPHADARNFVLCPGRAYDRSPCGTGTSAKLACLYAGGKIHPGDVWRQESVTGSLFTGQIEVRNDQLIPVITGTAFVNAEATLVFDEKDPLRWGMGV
ncbi:proline racemase family protein [Kamptonema cortianum]|nr:proline racemase family protein [Kamptonema cortianum]